MNNILSYQEVYDWIKEESGKKLPKILLGNGFSISYNKDIFSYKALLDVAEKKIESLPNAYQLFKSQESKDFEKVIRKLEITAETLKITDFDNNKTKIKELLLEADRVKNILAESIASLHLDRPYEIKDKQYHSCRNFLRQYSTYYTTNYDYLFYWSCMQDIEETETPLTHNDGFYSRQDDDEYVVWDRLSHHSQNVFYLHGALHLFKDSETGEVRKNTYVRSESKEALIEQTRKLLDKKTYPLVVAEGSADAKLLRVNESAYLHTGHRSLANQTGSMLIYGLSLSDNDKHIGEAIADSNIKRVAISIFGNFEDKNNQAIISAAEKIVSKRNEILQKTQKRNKLEIEYFDASSVRIWE